MIVGILLLLAAAGYRVAAVYLPGALPNFAPLMAIALCGGAFLPRAWAWTIPFGALFLSDALIDAHYGVSFLSGAAFAAYACYALAILAGRGLKPRLFPLLGAALMASTVFYLVTNTVAWLAEPAYAKSAAGWLQAVTTGLPGYAPTWTFFRNSLVADLGFTALYVGCMAAAMAKARTAPLPVTSARGSR